MTTVPESEAVGADVPALKVVGMSKTFGAAKALDDFSLTVQAGEIHAIVGENGSGKSTFIKILAGYHRPDTGAHVEVAGHPLDLKGAHSAYSAGCRFVHQDLGLVLDLSVEDNLALTAGYPLRFGTVRSRASRVRALRDLARFKLDLDPRLKVEELTPAQRTGVAIARSLREDSAAPPHVVILDEPTATLPEDEVLRLLDLVQVVASHGIGVVYVTHRLDEVFGLAQNVTVLRDGRKVASRSVAGLSRVDLVNLLVGGEFDAAHSDAQRVHSDNADPLLRVRDLRAAPLKDISFDICQREIVGLAGITGSGRESLLSVIFGGRPRESGSVAINETEIPEGRPSRSVSAGLAFLTADRKTTGTMLELTATENMSIADLSPYWKFPKINQRRERRESNQWFDKLMIRPSNGANMEISKFSGGNQQKILLAKWLRLKPRVLLLDEPTQGVDVGAKATIYQSIVLAAAEGAGVLISSSDVDELASLCHRVIILRDGHIRCELVGDEVSVKAISREALGAEEGSHR